MSITLRIPGNVNVPSEWTTLPPEMCYKLLKYAFGIFELRPSETTIVAAEQDTKVLDDEKRKIQEQFTADIERIRSSAAERIRGAEAKIADLEAKIAKQASLSSNGSESAELKAMYEEKIAQLKADLTAEKMIRHEAEKKRDMAAHQTLTEMREIIEPFRKMHSKDVSNTERGDRGEEWVRNLFIQRYPDAVITDTSTYGKSLDMHVTLRDKIIAVEVKNAKTVTAPQVMIFETTALAMRQKIHAAMLVSINSPVQGKGRFKIELHDGLPLIYLQLMHDSFLEPVVEALMHILRMKTEFEDFKRGTGTSSLEMMTASIAEYFAEEFNIMVAMVERTHTMKKRIQDLQRDVGDEEAAIVQLMNSMKRVVTKYPGLKPPGDVDAVAIAAHNSTQFTPEDIKKCLAFTGRLTLQKASELLGQESLSYVKSRGGLAALRQAIEEARAVVTKSEVKKAHSFTKKDIQKVASFVGKITYEKAIKMMGRSRDYIKIRGGTEVLNTLISRFKKNANATVTQNDESSDDDSSNDKPAPDKQQNESSSGDSSSDNSSSDDSSSEE